MKATTAKGWLLKEFSHSECSPWFNRFVWSDDKTEREILRKDSGLENELKSLKTEWEQIIRCMDYVHHLSDHQGFKESEDLTALGLLKGVKDGTITFRCVEFSHMLQHLLSAFGFPSRVLGLKKKGSDFGLGMGHVVVEAWSNQFSKWVILDPQMNLYYLDNQGNVLSAIEIHDLVRSGKSDEILLYQEDLLRKNHVQRMAKDAVKIEEINVPEGFSKEDVWNALPETGDFEGFWTFWKSYYYQFAVKMCHGLNDRTNNRDAKRYYYYAPEDIPPMMFQTNIVNNIFTHDRNRVYPALNTVEVQWTVKERYSDSPPSFELNLTHSMPWFSHYCIKVNHLPNEIISTENNVFVPIISGENIIEVFPVNDAGREGKMSKLVFHYS